MGPERGAPPPTPACFHKSDAGHSRLAGEFVARRGRQAPVRIQVRAAASLNRSCKTQALRIDISTGSHPTRSASVMVGN